MATKAQVNEFIKKVAPIVQKYAKQYNYKVVSPIIAQACLESGYGQSSLAYKYHNYFGMKCGSSWKGKSVNLMTKEEYSPGVITNIRDNFRVYHSLDEGIKGYFEFMSYSRYDNLKKASSPVEYLTLIKQDGYATASKYVEDNMAVVKSYNLTQYDTIAKEKMKEDINKIVNTVSTTDPSKKKTNEEIALEVIDGKWGAGSVRKKKLKAAGYNYSAIQKLVNKLSKK